MFGTNPVIVVLVVDPVLPPGLMVQFPTGNPLSATLPIAAVHVGCVIVPTIGVPGAVFTVANTAVLEALVHPLLDTSTK